MKAQAFRDWLQALPRLTFRQRVQMEALLHEVAPEQRTEGVVNRRAEEVRACPHCYSDEVLLWGRDGGIQRYRCRACHKTFNALTGTPLSHLRRRDAWLTYSQALIDGLSVRKAATLSGVHRTTAFRWRHRMLRHPAEENGSELSTLVEADETYFLESFKGQRHLPRPARHRVGRAEKRGLPSEQIPVLVAQDRQGKHFDAVLPRADKNTLSCLLLQLLAPETILCTDGAAAYRAVAKAAHIPHESLNIAAGIRVKQHVFHIQHVNAYDSRLKQWMDRFHGVATQYLPNYLGWRRLLEFHHNPLTPQDFLIHAMG